MQAVIGKADLAAVDAVHAGAAHQQDHHQHTGDNLGENGGQSHTQYPHAEAHNKQDIQDDVGHAGDDEEVERPLGITHRPKHARTHIVEERGDHAQGIDAQVQSSIGDYIGRGIHGMQCRASPQQGDDCGNGAAHNGNGHRGVHCLADTVKIPGAVALGDDNGGTGSHTHKQVDKQTDERTGGTTYRCQGHCTHIIAHNHSIGGVVELLEKGAQQDREEECQQRAEDPAFGDLVLRSHLMFHGTCTPPNTVILKKWRKKRKAAKQPLLAFWIPHPEQHICEARITIPVITGLQAKRNGFLMDFSANFEFRNNIQKTPD